MLYLHCLLLHVRPRGANLRSTVVVSLWEILIVRGSWGIKTPTTIANTSGTQGPGSGKHDYAPCSVVPDSRRASDGHCLVVSVIVAAVSINARARKAVSAGCPA
jgi:hypothetical protein